MIYAETAVQTYSNLGIQTLSAQAFLARLTMEDDSDETEKENIPSIKSDFDPDSQKSHFLNEDDFDLYSNKITGESYIFHGPDLPYEIEKLVYDPHNYTIEVLGKQGQKRSLGVKLQWLIRPYFSKARTIFVVQTKDGEAIDGVEVPMIVKENEENSA